MDKMQLINLLDTTDKTVIRCFENGVAVPQEWKTYRATLRTLITAGGGDPPGRPSYPEGT